MGQYGRVVAYGEKLLERYESGSEGIETALKMIDIYRNELKDLESARRWKARVHDWIWTEPNRFREIASKLAQDENNNLIAMGIYESLLLLEPESFEVLRFLGRISENMGKRERAYSYYSAILSLSCSTGLVRHRRSRSDC